jgi:hypothetical protein
MALACAANQNDASLVWNRAREGVKVPRVSQTHFGKVFARLCARNVVLQAYSARTTLADASACRSVLVGWQDVQHTPL